MKQILIGTLITFFCCHQYALAQSTNKDSILTWHIKGVQQRLSLSDTEASALLAARKMQKLQADSLANNTLLTVEQRGMELKKILTRSHLAIQASFSPEHWELYKKMEAAASDSLVLRAKAMHMPLKN